VATILIVEDDRAIFRGLETNLEFEGHRVDHVMRGDEAMARLESTRPDLLILDVMLPGLSGFEICRQVRRRDQRLPILVLTARGDDVDKVMGLDLGADDYLTKPFSLTELLARVRALLRRAASGGQDAAPRSVAIGDATIDFERYVAARGQERIHLTMKEFGLLRELVAADGAALTRDVILERVWGGDVNVTTRTVDTHVLALRQKLEPNPAQPAFILTVHGVGYRFAAAG
jgi:two-component system alkaline phosphatase synthesis response regulator PhoP